MADLFHDPRGTADCSEYRQAAGLCGRIDRGHADHRNIALTISRFFFVCVALNTKIPTDSALNQK